MKPPYKISAFIAAIAALSISLSSFNSEIKRPTASSYIISLLGIERDGTNDTWTWSVANPNPGYQPLELTIMCKCRSGYRFCSL